MAVHSVHYGKPFSHLVHNCRYLYLNTDTYNCVLNVKTACHSTSSIPAAQDRNGVWSLWWLVQFLTCELLHSVQPTGCGKCGQSTGHYRPLSMSKSAHPSAASVRYRTNQLGVLSCGTEFDVPLLCRCHATPVPTPAGMGKILRHCPGTVAYICLLWCNSSHKKWIHR